MGSRQVSMEEMTKRRRTHEGPQVDEQRRSSIPACRKTSARSLTSSGPGVTEDPDSQPAITDAEDFNLTYIGAEPGRGANLHSHSAGVEVFIPMTGTWAVFWGDQGRTRDRTRPGDVISVPPGHDERVPQHWERVRLPDGDPRGGTDAGRGHLVAQSAGTGAKDRLGSRREREPGRNHPRLNRGQSAFRRSRERA